MVKAKWSGHQVSDAAARNRNREALEAQQAPVSRRDALKGDEGGRSFSASLELTGRHCCIAPPGCCACNCSSLLVQPARPLAQALRHRRSSAEQPRAEHQREREKEGKDWPGRKMSRASLQPTNQQPKARSSA
jgi:hypothetical protein